MAAVLSVLSRSSRSPLHGPSEVPSSSCSLGPGIQGELRLFTESGMFSTPLTHNKFLLNDSHCPGTEIQLQEEWLRPNNIPKSSSSNCSCALPINISECSAPADAPCWRAVIPWHAPSTVKWETARIPLPRKIHLLIILRVTRQKQMRSSKGGTFWEQFLY